MQSYAVQCVFLSGDSLRESRESRSGSEKESFINYVPSLPLVGLVFSLTTVAAADMDVAVRATILMHMG